MPMPFEDLSSSARIVSIGAFSAGELVQAFRLRRGATRVQTSADQPVIDRGPYRFLRHPIYTGLLLMFTGVGLMIGNWVSAAGAVILILVALIYRLRVEERALNAALGDRYREFAASRARLIPHVW